MATTPVSKKSLIGASLPMTDAPQKVTGAGIYADDIAVPGMLIGRVLRSPHAHARIRSIDTSKAEALEGVKAVVGGAVDRFGTVEILVNNVGGRRGELPPAQLSKPIPSASIVRRKRPRRPASWSARSSSWRIIATAGQRSGSSGIGTGRLRTKRSLRSSESGRSSMSRRIPAAQRVAPTPRPG